MSFLMDSKEAKYVLQCLKTSLQNHLKLTKFIQFFSSSKIAVHILRGGGQMFGPIWKKLAFAGCPLGSL